MDSMPLKYKSLPTLWILIAFSAIFAITTYAYRLSHSNQLPCLQIGARRALDVNVGDILDNNSKEFRVKLHNDTGFPVDIVTLQKSCACVNFDVGLKRLNPGQTTDLHGSISAEERLGSFGVGLAVYWRYDNSQVENVTFLHLFADSVSLLRIDPASFDLGNLDADRSPIAFFAKIQRGSKAYSWNNLMASSGLLDVSFHPISANEFEMTGILNPAKIAIGPFNEDIKISLVEDGRALQQKVLIPVRARITSALSIKPSTIFLGTLARNSTVSGKFTIQSLNKIPLEPLSLISTDPQFISCSLDQKQGSVLYYSYKVSSGNKVGSKVGSLIIRIASIKNHDVRIPFISYVM